MKDNLKIYLGCDYYEGNFKEIALPFKFEPFEEQADIMNSIETAYEGNPFNIVGFCWEQPGGGKEFYWEIVGEKIFIGIFV